MGDFLLTFMFRSIKIELTELITIQIKIGEDSITLKQKNLGEEFEREFTLSLRLTEDELTHSAEESPGTLTIWWGTEQVGEVSLTHLSELFQKARAETEFKGASIPVEAEILSTDQTPLGVLKFFLSLTSKHPTKVEETKSNAETEYEDSKCCQEEVEEPLGVSSYFIVDGNLVNLAEIRGPCGSEECPVALLMQEEVHKASQTDMCFCEQSKEETVESFLAKMAAVDPYRQFERPSNHLYIKSFMQDLSSTDGEFSSVSKRGTMTERKRAGAVINASEKCPTCRRKLNCPLCKSQLSLCSSESKRSSPLFASLSEELANADLSKCRKMFGMPPKCCEGQKLKCPDCRRLTERKNSMSDESRYSMYASSKRDVRNLRPSYGAIRREDDKKCKRPTVKYNSKVRVSQIGNRRSSERLAGFGTKKKNEKRRRSSQRSDEFECPLSKKKNRGSSRKERGRLNNSDDEVDCETRTRNQRKMSSQRQEEACQAKDKKNRSSKKEKDRYANSLDEAECETQSKKQRKKSSERQETCPPTKGKKSRSGKKERLDSSDDEAACSTRNKNQRKKSSQRQNENEMYPSTKDKKGQARSKPCKISNEDACKIELAQLEKELQQIRAENRRTSLRQSGRKSNVSGISSDLTCTQEVLALKRQLKEVQAQKRKLEKKKKYKDDVSVSSEEMTCKEGLRSMRKRLKETPYQQRRMIQNYKMKPCYSYRFGNKHPRRKFGHRECTEQRGLVPRNMGWLWNVPTLGINCPRVGWKPGAVTKPIKDLMLSFLSSYPCDTLPNTKSYPCNEKHSNYTDPCLPNPPVLDKATLKVKKCDGEYIVSMNPLKDAKSLRAGEDPYLNCPPLTFRIVANEEEQKVAKCRKELRELGFKPCTCKNPKKCTCRTETEKALLNEKLDCLSHSKSLKTAMRPHDFTIDNTEKTDEFEFTPPSARIATKPKPPKKDTVTMETQYNEKDYQVVPTDNLLRTKGAGECRDPVTGKAGKAKDGFCVVDLKGRSGAGKAGAGKTGAGKTGAGKADSMKPGAKGGSAKGDGKTVVGGAKPGTKGGKGPGKK